MKSLISQEYYKTNYLEKILKNVGFEIVEKRDLFLYTNNKADKKMLL